MPTKSNPAEAARPNPSPSLRRSSFARLAAACLGSAAVLGAAPALAQTDINPPLPNVMLLVDTSGSMEYKVGTSTFPTCYPDGSGTSERSRWIDLVEVLTGTVQNYRCQSIDRMSTAFGTGEYGSGGALARRPYDYQYDYPYHRPLSGSCAIGPGTLNTSNIYDFADNTLTYHPYTTTAGTCTFDQAKDGILDAFENAIRFGLMTFDPSTGSGTGVSGTSAFDKDTGVDGTWSYVWGSSSTGMPAGCTTPQPWEVGARNAAAPPWEGRMVPFGNPNPGSTEFRTKKSQIERVLLATRPYGPTPIAGLMKDASDFLRNDTSRDPNNSAQDFGPRNDPWVIDSEVAGGCRKRFVILLSDGQPNMDLRPDCEGNTCPFVKPETIAAELAGLSRPIRTYVIGFALSSFTVAGRGTVTCNGLDASDLSPTNSAGLCNSTLAANVANKELQACCALNRIAIAGGSGVSPRAMFADNREALKSALSQILTETTNVTSRTVPVVSGPAAGSQGFRFYSSVRPVSFQPWVGILQRQRYTCDQNKPKAVPISQSKADDFAANLNAQPDLRTIASVRAGNGTETIYSERTVRPYYTASGTGDGGGVYGGARYIGTRTSFVSNTSPEAMKITDTSCDSGAINATACRNRYLNWLVGISNGTPYSRCPQGSGSTCYLFGDILHSTPAVIGPPSEFLRDESYERFVQLQKLRPVVLYTSTNDGFLHAFKVAPTDPTDEDKVLGEGAKNNELWAFVPPAILPHLSAQYPFTHTALLDGAPVVRDIVATTPLSEDAAEIEKVRFERSASDTNAGTGSWRTALLQSFGAASPAGGGYFALDVTNPVAQTNDTAVGPRFLWQLTTDKAGRALFGRTGTPAIATLFFDPRGGTEPRQIPVAILPGGAGPEGTLGAGCPALPDVRTFPTYSAFTARTLVRCYDTAEGKAARSLAIVRLDTGEIIRVFRQKKAEVIDTELQLRVTEVNIDSPISGQPVPFPAQVGATADRAYVGDQDGRLWRVNLASTDPSRWTMELFFDTFPAALNGDTTVTHDFRAGQPIMLPPVLSVDENGDITVAVATGDQETIGADPTVSNYVWSLTEKSSDLARTTDSVQPRVNWYQKFTGGERVVGPMSLFNSQLFFTTFAPPAVGANACSSGTSKVWGMDYIRPNNPDASAEPPRNRGGEARLPDASDGGKLVQSLSSSKVTGNANAVIFGVSVAQEPSCSQTATSSGDDFLGFGAETTIRNVNPGKFQLVMHVGGIENTTSTGDQQANVRTLDLKPPPNATRIDSWAALVE